MRIRTRDLETERDRERKDDEEFRRQKINEKTVLNYVYICS